MAGPIIKTRGRNRSDKIEREILDFIKRFEAGTDMFLHGCCYWFTHILSERFWLRESVAILYEPVEEHFITQIGGRYSNETSKSNCYILDFHHLFIFVN